MFLERAIEETKPWKIIDNFLKISMEEVNSWGRKSIRLDNRSNP